jgi:hypothetical protein
MMLVDLLEWMDDAPAAQRYASLRHRLSARGKGTRLTVDAP